MRLLQLSFASLTAAALLLALAGAARAQDFPKGTFTLKGPNDRVISITFDKGKMSVERDGEEIVKVDYKVTKDEVEFSNETGPRANKDAKPGTYKWKLDGKKLTFTKIKDESEGRAQGLTSGAWEKKE